MAFNGNGTFNRLHNWQQDAANGIDISAPEMDAEDNGFAAGLSNCVTRDGQGKMGVDFLPGVNNALNLGTAAAPWLTLNGVPITAFANGQVTPAETAAGVVPVNLGIAPGNALRYATNTTPGTTDMAAAISAACLQAAQSGGAVAVVPPGIFAIGSSVTVPSGITLIIQGTIIALAGTFTPGNFLLLMGTASVGNATQIIFQGGILDGAFTGTTCIANGIDVIVGRAAIHGPAVVVQHFPSYGVRFQSALSGDAYLINPQIQQWKNGDVPAQTQANYTGYGVYVNRHDVGISGATHSFIRWCLVNVFFDAGAGTASMRGFHVYQGNSTGVGGAFIDPINVQVVAGASNITMGGMYFDSGLIQLFSPYVTIADDCIFFQLSSAAVFNAAIQGGVNPAMIQLFYDGQTNPFQFRLQHAQSQNLAGNNNPSNANATILVGTYSNGGNYSGDYTALPTVVPAFSYQDISWAPGWARVCTHFDNSSSPFEWNYKPAGFIDEYYSVGTAGVANPVKVNYNTTGGSALAHFFVDFMQLTGNVGTSTKYTMNGGSSAIMDDGSNNFFLQTNNTNRLKLASGGATFNPATDNALTLGSGTNRYASAFFATAPTVGSDISLKTDVEAIAPAAGRELIMSLKPSTFRFKEGSRTVTRQVFRDPWGEDVPNDWTGFANEDGTRYSGTPVCVRARPIIDEDGKPILDEQKRVQYLDDRGKKCSLHWAAWVDPPTRKYVRAVRSSEAEVESTANAGVRIHMGFIAQDVREACKGQDLAVWGLADKADPSSIQTLKQEELLAPMVAHLQDHDATIQGLLATIVELKAEIAALKTVH